MQAGVWNAWLFFVFYWIATPLLMLRCPSILSRLDAGPDTPAERALRIAQWVLFFAFAIYSVFVPLEVGTIWFAVGLPIAIIGATAYGITVLSIPGSGLSAGPLNTGLYRFSRHPMYVSSFIMFVGVAIACASIPLLIYALAMGALLAIAARGEEQQCIVTYGDSYSDYARRTPQWLGLPRGKGKVEG